MNLKQDIKAALDAAAGDDALLELVRQHKRAGLEQRAAYDELQEVWLEFGFDNDSHDGENATRDNLEYLMEVVWGFCPAGIAIWPTSLSPERQPT
jgi:hypothetical protein